MMGACTPGAVQFEHTSELGVNTRGMAMHPDGDAAQVSMFGTTCQVSTQDASVGHDADYPSESEIVQDGATLHGDPAVAIVSPEGVHVTFPDSAGTWNDVTVTLPGTAQARLVSDGVVALDQDCGVHWSSLNGDLTSSDTLTGDCVDAGFAASPDGTAFVATGDQAWRLDGAGVTPLNLEADLVSWDPAVGLLYVASLHGDLLRAVTPDGAEVWGLPLDGRVVSFDDMGVSGTVAVMVERDNGTGDLLVVDGASGGILAALPTPSAADQVHVAESGDAFALVLEREVHFFRMQAPF